MNGGGLGVGGLSIGGLGGDLGGVDMSQIGKDLEYTTEQIQALVAQLGEAGALEFLKKTKNSNTTISKYKTTELAKATKERPGREATILTPRVPGDIDSTILGGSGPKTILGY